MSPLLNKKAFEFIASLIFKIFRYVLLICVGYIVVYPIIKIVFATS